MRVPDVADVQTRPTHRVKMVGIAGARVRRRWASWRRRPGSLTLCDGQILALKSHRPCEAHEGSSGHVTMRDRLAYYLSRPLTA